MQLLMLRSKRFTTPASLKVREIILARITEAAKSGERDPVRLRQAALPWLAYE